jgi:hypothetical protein
LKECLYIHQHYSLPDFICHRCEACKIGPRHGWRYTVFRHNAEHRSSLYTHDAWMKLYTFAALVSPLIFIAGFHVTRVIFDMMHCMDLGMLQVLVPSVIRCMVKQKRFTGSVVAEQYTNAFIAYKRWGKQNRVISMAKKRFTHKTWGTGPGGYPRVSQLQAKAAAMRSMLYWLEDELKRDHDTDINALQYAIVSSFCKADRVCRRSGRHFTVSQHDEFCNRLQDGLVAYNGLAQWAITNNLKLFKVLPKMHAMTHYYDVRLNPRRCQCYADEDMVGRMKKIYIRWIRRYKQPTYDQ